MYSHTFIKYQYWYCKYWKILVSYVKNIIVLYWYCIEIYWYWVKLSSDGHGLGNVEIQPNPTTSVRSRSVITDSEPEEGLARGRASSVTSRRVSSTERRRETSILPCCPRDRAREDDSVHLLLRRSRREEKGSTAKKLHLSKPNEKISCLPVMRRVHESVRQYWTWFYVLFANLCCDFQSSERNFVTRAYVVWSNREDKVKMKSRSEENQKASMKSL